MSRTLRRRTDGQTGPWVLAIGVLTVGTVALARELRRNRDGRGSETAETEQE